MRFRFEAPAFPPAAVQLRDAVRRFLAEQQAAGAYTPHSNSWMSYDAAFTRACGLAGFIGLTLPREYGGGGRSALERYVVYEEMLAAGAPVGMHWIADRQSGPQIARNGTDVVRRAVLPRIVAGQCCIGIGMSEPDAGSDLAAVRTTGTRVEGGWRLRGTKLWTSHAHRADFLIVLARTAPPQATRHDGLSQFLVHARARGVATHPIRDLTGGTDFNEVVLDDVFVHDDYLLGTAGDGWRLVTQELAFERSGPDRFLTTFPLLAQMVGMAGPAADDTTAEALGELVGRMTALRHMSTAIAHALDEGASPLAEAAIVKDLGSALERAVPEVARQRLAVRPDPGAGARFPAQLADAMLASPSFTLRGGTREILRGIVARELGLR
ncbi:MAG: acyl-CoA dehydrogenase family protein [Proteobacteria bacterium]|nr:acyl-CoA dehydrogenase family protein [Pseudomonadota bacterium]